MITFKTIEDQDHPFILKVYRSTREKELLFTYLTEEQKNSFIWMQLTAQLTDYKKNYKGATYQIIVYNRKPAGRLYLWETINEIRILDISLLPEFQGKGIGTEILTNIIKSAKVKNKKVSLHVTHDNPAKNLYKRLGFKKIITSMTHDYMEFKEENLLISTFLQSK